MRLDALLRAHSYMNVQRPPEIWEADTEDVGFVPLLGEMIAAALSSGAELNQLTLNAANVVMPLSGEDEEAIVRPGDYVAVTVSGPGDLGRDASWTPSRGAAAGLLLRLDAALRTAGSAYAYVRSVPPTGSVTVFLQRLRNLA
jgi:hypothetical protein